MRPEFENRRLRTMIWLIDLLDRKGPLTLKQINEAWVKNEDLSKGQDLERRTFINHKNAIFDLFNIIIECDTRNGYKYYIEASDNTEMVQWLIKSVATSSTIASNSDLRDRILLEQVPAGEDYLPQILDAMRNNKKIAFDYQRFHDSAAQHIKGDPYCVKIFQQRWYVLMKEYRTLLGSHEVKEEMRVYSFDRMSNLQILEDKFTMDKNFNAKEFFRYAWGVRVEPNNPPVKILLKVKSVQCPYFRTLPLHRSQREIEIHAEYSVFEITAALTVEVVLQILHYGSLVEVLSPEELREEIANETFLASMQYECEEDDCLDQENI